MKRERSDEQLHAWMHSQEDLTKNRQIESNNTKIKHESSTRKLSLDDRRPGVFFIYFFHLFLLFYKICVISHLSNFFFFFL